MRSASSLLWFGFLSSCRKVYDGELYAPGFRTGEVLFVHFSPCLVREDLLKLDAAGLIAFVEDDHIDARRRGPYRKFGICLRRDLR